jgi:hypothetical protein
MLARLAAAGLAIALVAAEPESSTDQREDRLLSEDLEPVPEPGWSHLERMGSLGGGFVTGVAATNIGGNRVVTAVRNEAGNLKLIVWQVEYDGSVTRLGSAEGEPMPRTRLAIAPLQRPPFTDVRRGRFVTAIRLTTGLVKLTVWTVREDGTIVRRGSRKTGETQDADFALATFSSDRVVTAVHDAVGRMKLISWHVDDEGTVTRLDDAIGEKVDEIALATYDSFPPDTGRLATIATAASDGALKVRAWSVDEAGAFQLLGSKEVEFSKDIAASALSHRRIVTASRDAQNRLVVRSWDFDEAGNPSVHATGHAGEVSNVDVTSLAATRVVTAVRNGSGDLTIITWDGVDDLVRLGTSWAGTVDRVSIVPLGSDWLATPVRDSNGNLKVIAWKQHAVSLLRGRWKPDDVAPVTVGPPDRFEPGVNGQDPHIAVGSSYIVITNNTRIGFFDKSGHRFGPTITTNKFFSTFLVPRHGTRPNIFRNEHSIQRHLGFPAKGAVDDYPPGASVHCDPANAKPLDPPPPCIGQFNDARTFYDPTSRRFFVVSSARPPKCVASTTDFQYGGCESNQTSVSKPARNPLYRRYWAFAVSRTEDPRDGFYQWMSTEPATTFDYPRFSVNQGVMLVESNAHGYAPWLPAMGRKPYVYALSVDDLLQGKAYPRSRKIFPSEFFGTKSFTWAYDDDDDPSNDPNIGTFGEAYPDVFPVIQYGDAGGRSFLVTLATGETGRLDVFSFVNPTDWTAFPPIQTTSTHLTENGQAIAIGYPSMVPVMRDGKVYHAWHRAGTTNGATEHRDIRFMRFEIQGLPGVPAAEPVDLSVTFTYGAVTAECPALAVTRDGHIVILYGRRGFLVPLNHEARYSIFYADGRGLQPSQLLHGGEFLADKAQYCGGDGIADYVTATIDPADQGLVWVIANYTDKADNAGESDGVRTIVGQVRP